MSWLEKRERWRLRDIIGGVRCTPLRDLGKWKEAAEECQKEYDRARTLGFEVNPQTPVFMEDVRGFLKAKAEGRQPQMAQKDPDLSFNAFIKDRTRDDKTKKIYRSAYENFKRYKKPTTLNDFNKENVDDWRSAMEDGRLLYSRNKGKTFRRYSATTIKINLGPIKSFLKFCGMQDWINAKIPQSINIKRPPSTRRFLTRLEVARLMRACRVENYRQKGGGRRLKSGIEQRVLAFSVEHPQAGKQKISKDLAGQGIAISPTGVTQVWKRYGIGHAKDRVKWQKARALPPKAERAPAICRNPHANNRLRKIMLFGLYTGMRTGEVLRASWENVTAQEVLLRTKDGRIVSKIIYSLFIPKAKKHRQRTVAFHPRLAVILGAVKRAGSRGRIFPEWTENGMSQARRRAVTRAGLTRVRFHDLRHSFVRNYLKSGAGSIAQLREHTGHENLASLDPYAHFANADVAATIPDVQIK